MSIFADDVTMSHRYEIIGICNKLPFLQNVYFRFFLYFKHYIWHHFV